MITRFPVRLYGVLAAALLSLAAPASAQFTPRTLNDPATGEQFHIEGSAGWWWPSANINIGSEQFGNVGTDINLKSDLGLTDQRFSELHLVLRPALKHKFRFQYVPIQFVQETTLKRTVVFIGQRYSIGFPVKSALTWKAYRFAYEYDFLVKNRGFAGVILDTKYTDIAASLQVPFPPIDEFVHYKVPIPAIGGIGRVYVVPNISITGELTGFKVPQSLSEKIGGGGHFADLDIYGTVNFTNNIGVKGGYRTFDLGYQVDRDLGSLVLKGIYIGVVARY
jgi:hypothetical protein